MLSLMSVNASLFIDGTQDSTDDYMNVGTGIFCQEFTANNSVDVLGYEIYGTKGQGGLFDGNVDVWIDDQINSKASPLSNIDTFSTSDMPYTYGSVANADWYQRNFTTNPSVINENTYYLCYQATTVDVIRWIVDFSGVYGGGSWYSGAIEYTARDVWFKINKISIFLPTFISYNISNSAPIRTNDVIDVNFKLDNDEQETNVSLTWFKSTDNSTWTAHTSDNETWNNVTLNTTINSNSAGDLEAIDTTAGDYWKAQLTATNPTGSTAVNTSVIYIENDPPQVTSSTSSTTNENPVNIGENIIFQVSGTDIEEDVIKLKVCSNSGANWSNCNVLAQNLIGISWSSVSNTTVTATHTTNETIRENTAYAIVFDGGDYGYANITYYVNQYPVLENIVHQDTNGDSSYFFKESIDYFRVNMNDSYNGTSLTPYITVTDPEGVINIYNQSMSLTSGTTFEYGTDLYLNAIGTWTINISVTDSDGATTTLSDTFSVSSTNLTSLGRIYAYDTGEWTNYTDIETLMTDYGFYAVEIHVNNSIMENNWTAFKSTIEEIKNNSKLVIITLDDDLSNQTRTINNINSTYSNLIGGNYLNGILMLKINPISATNTTDNTNTLNAITKEIFQETQNYFPIYIKDYVSTEINTNYADEDIYTYISTNNRTTYVNEEMSLLRTSTDKSRFYNNLTDTFKGYARDWQNNVINKLRSGINASTSYTGNIAELNNLDLIVANNQSTSQSYSISSVAGTSGKDIYDLTSKAIIELDTDQSFNVTVEPYSAHILYFTNLEKIVVNDEDQINLFGDAISGYPSTNRYGGAGENAFQFVSGSTNPDDGRIFITDPSYIDMDFYVWYGTAGYEAIADWSRYNRVIVGDKNESWVENIGAVTNVYGYTAVNNYGDNNMPDGCTAGVDCTSWNRTKWINLKKTDIDSWSDMNETVQIFIDGLDIGAVNDVDSLFGEALIELTDYVKTTKNKEVILNTYTAYQDYANLGDYTMRESACGRWEGTESSATYEYENITLEKQRANFHKTHNVPVLAQVFGNITDYEKSYYCYMQTKVLYGDLAEISYNQPLFDYTNAPDDYQWNFYKYPDLGVALEDDYTESGDLLTRTFEKGIVTVNTTSKEVTFENNLNLLNMQFCGYYYDNDDGANDEGYMHFVINDNLSKAFNVYDNELTAFVKTWKCVDLPTTLYEPSGWYELEFYYLDNDANYIGNSGLYMYNGYNASQDKLSSWDQTLNDHPSNDESEYWQYGLGTNWAVSLMVNATRETPIGEVTSAITRTESGTEVKNVTFSSDTDWDLPVYDKQILLNKTQWNGIFVGSTNLNANYDSSCNTNAPTYSSKNIGLGTYATTTNSLECSGSWSTCEGWTNNGSTAVGWWNTDGSYSIYIGDTGVEHYIEKNFSYVQNITLDMWVQSGTSLEVYINDVLQENFTTSGNGKLITNPNPTENDHIKLVGDGILVDNIKTTTESYDTWQSCYYNATGGGYDVKVIIPHLSTQTYLVDGNTYPTVDSQSISLNNLLNGNQNLTISFNVSDADNNTISACKVDIDGTMTTGTYSNGTCLVTLNTYLNSTSQNFTPYVYDEYSGNGSGSSYNSITSIFDSMTWDNLSTTSNQSIQYFWNNYNLTYDWNLNFTNINWSINSTYSPVLVNLTNGTNSERFERNYSLVTESNYTLIPDGADTYYVNQGETIWKLFNITNNLGTTLPQFNMSFIPTQYITGTQSFKKYNGSSWVTQSFTSGNPIRFISPSISDGSKNQYNVSHQSKVIYTTGDDLTYTQSGSTRTYFWNATNGLKYNFMFAELLDISNSIYHNIAYASLPNWASRTSSSKVMKDNDGNSLVENADYTVTDNTGSELVILNFAPLSGDTFYNFNLSYTAEVVTYQCSDGIDNDGDGLIDYPADTGCTSSTDDTENSETSTTPSTGGGGGGGGSSTPSTDLSAGKIVCDVYVTPKSISLDDSELLQDLRIRNDETFGFDPEFSFQYVSGDSDLVDKLRITNSISLVDSGKESLTGVRLSTFFLSTGTAKANLVISSTKCVDIKVPIDIKINEQSGVAEIIKEVTGENKTISEVVIDLSDKSFFAKDTTTPTEEESFISKAVDKVFSVLGLTMIIGLLMLFVVIPTGKNPVKYSQNTFLDITARFIIWAVVTGLIGIVILVLHIMFFS